MDPLTAISPRSTPQTQRAAGPEGARQTKNGAGGYTFAVEDDVRVRRFLTLGVEGGTYYASERQLTADNAKVVLRCAKDRASWLVGEVVAVSEAGRAPRNNPALFALAAAASMGDDEGRRAALDALPRVARTGTHLFTFAGYIEQFRGWGRGLRRAVGAWYTDRPVEGLAYQAAKYRQRGGWTHRDLLRLSHPTAMGEPMAALFDWIVRGTACDIPLIEAYSNAQTTTDVATWVRLIEGHGLSWEMLPDAALTEPRVWEALVARGVPQTALIRQLPRLTRLGVLRPGSDTLRTVVAQVQDTDRLRKARVHPVNVLVAQRTYASGRSVRGESSWTPVRQVVDALDAAFYGAFSAVEPTGKRTLLALDVSGSMGWSQAGMPVTCREASAALALVTMATEPEATCVGFTAGRRSLRGDGITELSISPRQRLDDAIRAISDLPFGGTDCALPFTWAMLHNLEFDAVVVYTDNETHSGPAHVHQQLARYRDKTGIPTRLIVVGMTATDCSIADPLDPLTMDVAGFDSAVPNLIADFSRGAL